LARRHLSGITIGKETEMPKKKGNAGSRKSSAETKAMRSTAKAQKTGAAKDAAAVKAVLDAEALREVDENEGPVEEISPPAEGSARKQGSRGGRAGAKEAPQARLAEGRRQPEVER
jgi:hypothetical protein